MPLNELSQRQFHQIKGNKMAEHKHGSMDTKGHEQTFSTFIRFTIWGAGISIATLIFLYLANG
jgi:hypothetical protein